MSGFPILDLVLGMIFIYFLLSIITSSAVEVVLTVLRVRANMLAEWLCAVFNQPALLPDGSANEKTKGEGEHKKTTKISLGQAIMDHCMTTVLTSERKSTAYINSADFVVAFLDQISRVKKDDLPLAEQAKKYQEPPADVAGYIEKIQKTPVLSEELRRTVLALAREAQRAFPASTPPNPLHQTKSDIELFKEKLANWYDSNTERLVERLKKRWAFWWTLGLATLITLFLNADTIAMSRYLYNHPAAARALADKAAAAVNQTHAAANTLDSTNASTGEKATIEQVQKASAQLKQSVDSLKAILAPDFPIGYEGEQWKDTSLKNKIFISRLFCCSFWEEAGAKHAAGWLATILAILLGAPFWFDLLNRIANLRGSGPKPPSTLNDVKGNTTINN